MRVRTLLRLTLANALLGAVVFTFVPLGQDGSAAPARPLPATPEAAVRPDEDLADQAARLRHGTPDVRRAAARALARRDDPAAQRLLEGLRRDADPGVRRMALLGLADRTADPRRLRALLVEALCDGPAAD